MRANRSVPPCAVIPVLIYPDPGAAADWLSKAFGFTVRLRIANHRIQMKAGDGCFTIAEGKVAKNTFTFSVTHQETKVEFTGEFTGNDMLVWMDRQGRDRAAVLKRQ